jgi:predicted transcriptional regulator
MREDISEATMTTNPLLSDELLHQVEETARIQNRQPAEVVSEAVSKYLKAQRWASFVERNERRAKELGIAEDEIPRLIAETRAENKQRDR